MKTLLLTLLLALKALAVALVSFVVLRIIFKAKNFDFLDISQNPFGRDKF